MSSKFNQSPLRDYHCHSLGACRTWAIESDKWAEQGQILAISPAHSGTMVYQKLNKPDPGVFRIAPLVNPYNFGLQGMRRALTLLAFALLVSAGCGYQFTVQGPGPVIGESTGMLPQEPPIRLAVQTFRNNSYEPNLEFKYSRYLRQAMQSAGSAEFVDDRSADFILGGTILSVALPSLSFSSTQTREARVIVKVAVSVRDRRTGNILWAQTVTSMAPYYVGATAAASNLSGLQFNRVLQDRAVEQAGMLAAADLADRFLWAKDKGRFSLEKEEHIPVPTGDQPESFKIPEPSEDLLPH